MLSVAANPRSFTPEELKSREIRAREGRVVLASLVSKWIQPYSASDPLRPIDQTANLVDSKHKLIADVASAKSQFKSALGIELDEEVAGKLPSEVQSFWHLELNQKLLVQVIREPEFIPPFWNEWLDKNAANHEPSVLEATKNAKALQQVLKLHKDSIGRLADFNRRVQDGHISAQEQVTLIKNDSRLQEWATALESDQFAKVWKNFEFLQSRLSKWISVSTFDDELAKLDAKLKRTGEIWASVFAKPEAARIATDLNIDTETFGPSQAVADIDAIAEGEEIRIAREPVGASTPDFGSL